MESDFHESARSIRTKGVAERRRPHLLCANLCAQREEFCRENDRIAGCASAESEGSLFFALYPGIIMQSS